MQRAAQFVLLCVAHISPSVCDVAGGAGSVNSLPAGSGSRLAPSFDATTPRNVTALVGKSAYLSCRVRNLGNRTSLILKNVVAQTRAARSLLRPVLASHLPLRAKQCVYKAYIRKRLTYTAPAWFALVIESGRKSLQAQQSLALRTISGAPRFVWNQVISRDMRMESLDNHVRRLSASMFARADGARSQHLRGTIPSTTAGRKRIGTRPSLITDMIAFSPLADGPDLAKRRAQAHHGLITTPPQSADRSR